MRLQFAMWKYHRSPDNYDGVISRFTDGKGVMTDSWWSSPPEDIDHVGIEYLSQPHRHPNVKTVKHEESVKRRFKEEMARLAKEELPIFHAEDIKSFDNAELHGKQLTMIYGFDSGYGVLSGVDQDGKIYVLHTIKEG